MTDPHNEAAPPAFNREYALQLLEELLSIPSPTGFTYEIMRRLAQESEKLGFRMEHIAKGGGFVTVEGTDPKAPGLLVSAHADTLGAMVRSVNGDGTLRMTPVGGYMMQSIENEYCLIHTRDGRVYSGTVLTSKPSVHVWEDAREQKRDESCYAVRIDEPASGREDVLKLGIAAGDFISFDARPVFLPNGYIKARHLDDKAGVAVLFALLEALSRTGVRPRRNVTFFISNYEEIGHGSSYLPVEAEEMLAVDMGAMGADLTCTERDVSICAKDSGGPYDYGMTSRLIAHAQRLQLSYAVDIYPRYGSDATAALRAGRDIRAALIGPGVHASHAMERTHEDALRNTYMLLAAFALE